MQAQFITKKDTKRDVLILHRDWQTVDIYFDYLEMLRLSSKICMQSLYYWAIYKIATNNSGNKRTLRYDIIIYYSLSNCNSNFWLLIGIL